MSTRLVVGLDGSPFAARALEAGLRRASRHGSTLIGVAVIDQPAIEQVEVGAYPGSIQLSHETVSRLFNEAKVRAQQSIENFRDLCTRADVLFEDVIHSGSAADALNEEGKTADMILIGIRTFFRPGREDRLTILCGGYSTTPCVLFWRFPNRVICRVMSYLRTTGVQTPRGRCRPTCT